MSYSKPRKRKYTAATRQRNRERNLARDACRKQRAIAKWARRAKRRAA